MKKTLLLGLLGMMSCATTSFGQGTIRLDNYNSSGPLVTYGPGGTPANGVSGPSGTPGTGLLAGWTFGFYYALGTVSVGSDPTGMADPSVLGGGLALATGNGSTAPFYTSSFNTPGTAKSGTTFSVPGTAIGGGDTITVMAVAYSGASYTTSSWRGHSAVFAMTTSVNTSPNPNLIGSFMPGFSIPIPEPSIFALAGLSAVAVTFFRRRKFRKNQI